MFKGVSWSSLVLLGVTSAVGLMAGCGDDDDTTTTTGPTGPSSSSSSSSASSSSSGGMGGTGGTGGTGGMAAGGSGGTGGAPDFTDLASGNVLTNDGFESFTSPGAQPPFDPADSWDNFGVQLAPTYVEYGLGGYTSHATQADGADIFPTTDPFPGLNGTRALKMFGIASDGGGGNLGHTLGTIYQTFTGGTLPPAGSQMRLTGWAYHASQDPLGTESQAYLVIKCFNGDFSQQLCGMGGTKSTPITSTTTPDGWVQYVVDVASLDANAVFVQAGVEFEQCLSGTPCSGTDGAGAVFFDDLVFSYE